MHAFIHLVFLFMCSNCTFVYACACMHKSTYLALYGKLIGGILIDWNNYLLPSYHYYCILFTDRNRNDIKKSVAASPLVMTGHRHAISRITKLNQNILIFITHFVC